MFTIVLSSLTYLSLQIVVQLFQISPSHSLIYIHIGEHFIFQNTQRKTLMTNISLKNSFHKSSSFTHKNLKAQSKSKSTFFKKNSVNQNKQTNKQTNKNENVKQKNCFLS